MDKFKGAIALESAQFIDSDFAEELLVEFQRLRDVGDFSQAAMKKCKVTALTKLYTDIKLDFIISDKIYNNAYFEIPDMDKNHPWFQQMFIAEKYGIGSGVTLQSIRDSGQKTKMAGVDLRTGRVKGWFKDVKVTIVIAHNFFTDKKWKTENIVGIFGHELGHAFTYFEYFGNITRTSTLIDQASRTVMDPGYSSEQKVKLLKEVERQLGTEELGLEKTVNLPGSKAKTKVQEVLITQDVFRNTRTESSTPFYDARNVEQLADQFCVIHGMGRWQAEALSTLYKSQYDSSTLNALSFFMIEIIKLTVFLAATVLNPILVLVYGFTFFPTAQWYDKPRDRIVFLKRQMIANLRSTDDKVLKAKLTADINAVDQMLEQYNKYPTIFDLYCNFLNPVGRRMFKEEKFRKQIEDAINNDLHVKAAELEMLK